MKAIINTAAILFCNLIFAQGLPVLSTTSLSNPDEKFEHPKNGNYAMDDNNERDQYIGLWEYNQNGIVFQLKIQKHDKVLNKIEYNGIISHYNYFDQVDLRYKLIKNGVTVFDNLNQGNIDPITSYGIKNYSNYLEGFILDHTRNAIGSYTIEKLSSIPKIKFNLILGNYRLLNDNSFYQDGQPLFSIPIGGIEMVKIN